MTEIWKPVKGYEGLYEVSNKGRVKSLKRYSVRFGHQKELVGEKLMSLHKSSEGYIIVHLSKDGERKSKSVHRLVAQAFIPNPHCYPLINHKDENKANNHVENLEWCTQEYNVNYGTAHKRARTTHKLNKIKGKTEIDKALLQTHITKTALARGLDVSRTTLRNWILDPRKKHYEEILIKIKELENKWQKDEKKQIKDLIEFRKEAKRIFGKH